MAKGASVEVKGLSELVEDLKSLPPAVQDKVLKPGLKAAGQIILEAAIAKAPVGKRGRFFTKFGVNRAPGNLKKSIRVGNVLGNLKGLRIPIFVDKEGKTGAFYAGMVEYGHGLVIPVKEKGGKMGKKPIGTVPPRPFMRPALDESTEPAIEIFRELLAKGIARQVRKLGK